MAVFVLDKRDKPSMACPGKRARQLMSVPYRRSRLLARDDGYAHSPAAGYSGQESENKGGDGRRAVSVPGLKARVSRARSR